MHTLSIHECLSATNQNEVQFLKNTNPLMHRAVELLETCERLFSTGTPMTNRPVDLVSIL